MLSNNVGGMPGLELLLQHQLLLLYLEREQEEEEQETIVRGVSWLREPLSKPKADPVGAPPDVDAWTCPRCGSHRCMRVNPGNVQDPVYCCSVCGYRFRKASATSLQEKTGCCSRSRSEQQVQARQSRTRDGWM